MRSRDDSRHNLISYVMVVNLNVLCILIKGGIARDEDSGLGQYKIIRLFYKDNRHFQRQAPYHNAWAFENEMKCRDL